MSSINPRYSRRRRRRKPIHAYHPTPHSTAEERLLQQAIANSRADCSRPKVGSLVVPAGPTFYPTLEEFEGNPLHFINKIRPIAEKYGICKIVPPDGWDPPFCVDMASTKKFQTKEQLLHRLQEGISFGDGEEYTPEQYVKMAREKILEWQKKRYPHHGDTPACSEKKIVAAPDENDPTDAEQSRVENDTTQPENRENQNGESEKFKQMTPENLEADYWDIVETNAIDFVVEYGNDVDTAEFGSGFPRSERGRSVNSEVNSKKILLPEPKFGTDDYYKETGWNLNNVPCCTDSILRHVKVGINGINVPWMYYGCLYSTFCWHNEDNYLYSINYHHWGAPKLWYGVPGTKEDADGLERVFKNYLSMKMRDVPDLLHHITTMFSPRLLQRAGVPVFKILQHPGEFVVTFPRAFHGGFSLGPNIGEAVNFATHDWIAHGADANERYRSFARPAVFSHDRLTFTMANHLAEQKAFSTCILLVGELERVIEEELRLRRKLFDSGVRDVSADITLPKNRLDQLDEESADYDDKRLCHACKHVCFFSCVACECSQSKVSCLRHSHYMCRCPTERKYMMVWSSEQEMACTLDTVKRFCDNLKPVGWSKKEKVSPSPVQDNSPATPQTTTGAQKPPVAPGSQRNYEKHRNYRINLNPFAIINSRARYNNPPEEQNPAREKRLPSLQQLSDSKRMKPGFSNEILLQPNSNTENGNVTSDSEGGTAVVQNRLPPFEADSVRNVQNHLTPVLQ